jgi:hypothetical protein
VAALATLAEIKAFLGGVTKTTDDALLQMLLDGQAARLSRVTGRSFTRNPALDDDGVDSSPDAVVTLQGNYRRRISIPDARVVTSVAVDGTVLDPTAYRLVGDDLAMTDLTIAPPPPAWPGGALLPWDAWGGWGAAWGIGLHNLGQVVTVTGRFGITPVPADVKDAFLMMVARAYKEKDARYGDMVELPDGGSVNYFRQFPPRVAQTIALISRSPRLS